MKKIGLRTKVSAVFAIGALVLTSAMALLSYELTRTYLLAERERSALRTTYFDATVVKSGLEIGSSESQVLGSLDPGTLRRPLLRHGDAWFSRNADLFAKAVPQSLIALAEQGTPGMQRVSTVSGPALVHAVPLSTLGGPSDYVFYEVHLLREVENTLQLVALVLILVAAFTTCAGAGLGWYVTRRMLRPLSQVAAAAQGIAGGDLSARLDPAAEPELQRLTDSFNDMVDQLARRIERDRRFAADVSHELRSPLQTLAAAASVLMRSRDRLDERTATAAGLVADEVTRFEHLVTDLLELARTDQAPDRRPVDVADLARQICRSRGAEESMVTVVNGSDSVWQVDPRRFGQVLTNLLDNADRHGGGPTAIRVGDDGTMRYLEVDDEGPGVLPEEREIVFNPFVRGRSARARGDSDGTGLGLALVAQHVAAHGGRVAVGDRPGGGARFRVEIPRDES